jgi:hypothetical protein
LPGSHLRLEAPVWDEARGGVVLRWLSAPGVRYVIEASKELVNANWEPVSLHHAGTGHGMEHFHAVGGKRPGFYRIRVSP